MTLGMRKKKNRSDDVAPVIQVNEFSQWDMFVKVVAAHVDPVLASMLYATQFVKFDQTQHIVHVATLKKFVLFQDLFIEQKKNYQEYLDRIFGFKTVLVVDFVLVSEKIVVKKNEVKNFETSSAQNQKKDVQKQVLPKQVLQKTVDVSDQKKWKVTHALLEHFGGTVKEIVKEKHEFDA
jgi:hypothetical protein